MRKGKKLLYLVKFILSTALFCGAVYFENAQQQRFLLLVVLFAAFLGSGLVRYLAEAGRLRRDLQEPELPERQGQTEHTKWQEPPERRDNPRKLTGTQLYLYLTFYLDIILIFFMEQNSRLLINYFFHSFYLIVLLEAALTLSMKKGLAAGAAAVLVSMVKYGFLIYYRSNLASASQAGFFLLASLLVLAAAVFAQHNREERQKKDILYKDLLDAHRQLKQYADEVRRLGVQGPVAGQADQAEPRKDPRAEQLTERETDICRLIAKGKNNQEIAKELFLSTGTVKNHITRILIKLDMRDRTQLAIFAIKNDL
jgi:DNA-binding NarL/FixJ family response regulator